MELIRKTVASTTQERALPRQDVLLLNASEEPIGIIPWQRAIALLFSGKVHAPYNFEFFYRFDTTGGVFDLPTAVVLSKYVRIPRRIMPLTRRNLLRRDGHQCQYCGTGLGMDSVTIDHVVPTSKGGENKWQNVVACCQPCNARKGNRSMTEVGYKLKRKPWVPTNYDIVSPSPKDSLLGWDRWIFE